MGFNGKGALNGAVQGASTGSTFGPKGAIIGGIAGGIMGGFGKKKNSARDALLDQEASTKRILKFQQDYNNWYTQNQFGLLMQGAKDAGLHPFYGLANGHSPTSASASMPDYVGQENAESTRNKNITDAIQNGVQIMQDWSAKKAQINLMEQQAKTEQHNTNLKRLEVLGKEIENLSAKKNLDWQDRILLINYKKEQQALSESIARTTQINLDNEVQDAKNRFYRNHPYLTEAGEAARHLSELTGLPAKYLDSLIGGKTKTAKKVMKNRKK